MEGLNQSSEMFDPRSLDSPKTLTEGTTAETLHQRPAVALVRPYNAIGLDVASLRTPAGPPKQHPSLPDRPVIAEIPLPMKPLPVSNDDTKARLTRDLWDTRKKMVALQGHEIDLIAALRRLDVAQHTLEVGLAQCRTTGIYFRATFGLR